MGDILEPGVVFVTTPPDQAAPLARSLVAAIASYLDKHHPYDVPECVFVPITAGSEAYLSWLGNETL